MLLFFSLTIVFFQLLFELLHLILNTKKVEIYLQATSIVVDDLCSHECFWPAIWILIWQWAMFIRSTFY